MEMHIGDIQFVVGSEGKPTAVLVDIVIWERILDALEDAEDITIVRETLASLEAASGDPLKAGFIPWEQARAELEQLDGSEA